MPGSFLIRPWQYCILSTSSVFTGACLASLASASLCSGSLPYPTLHSGFVFDISTCLYISWSPSLREGTKIVSPLSPSGVSAVVCLDKQVTLVTSGQLRFYHVWLWNAPYTIYCVPTLCSWLRLAHSKFFGTLVVSDRNRLRPD